MLRNKTSLEKTAEKGRLFGLCFACLIFLRSLVCPASERVVVVCPPVFQKTLQPWIEHRNEQGYTISLITEPSGNQATTSEHVKEQIRQLAEQNSIAAVLLVGNGVERFQHRPDRVVPSPTLPCRIIQHFSEETQLVADDWYADLDDDGLPDFPIGRFPADSPEELDVIIRKTLRYETEFRAGVWCRRMQIIAGIGNFSPLIDGVIESTAKHALTEAVPNSWEISLLHANWKSPFCPSVWDYQRELSETLNRDCLFWIYLGHGYHRMLDPLHTPQGYVPSLHADEFPALTNRDSLPIALLFCCYGGMLDLESRSLAEEMLLQEHGPVAVLAASRTTMPYGMSVFGIELLQELLAMQNSTEPSTLGRLTFLAKRKMLRREGEANAPQKDDEKTTPSRRKIRQRPFRESLESLAKMLDPQPMQLDVQLEEHAALFHLFGDPLLRLPKSIPVSLDCPKKLKPGEILDIQGRCDLNEGTVRLELLPAPNRISLSSPRRNELRLDAETRRLDNEEYARANDRIVGRDEVSVLDGKFVAKISIPAEARGAYVIRAFASNDSAFGLGAADVEISRR